MFSPLLLCCNSYIAEYLSCVFIIETNSVIKQSHLERSGVFFCTFPSMGFRRTGRAWEAQEDGLTSVTEKKDTFLKLKTDFFLNDLFAFNTSTSRCTITCI